MSVWIGLSCVHFLRLHFFFCAHVIAFRRQYTVHHYLCTVHHCLCTVHHCSRHLATTTLFKKIYIKNGSHVTIYIFKIILLQCFQFSVFNFQQNKLYPNEPLDSFM